MPKLFSTSWLICAALLSPFDENQSIIVTPSKVVTLGIDGDVFGIDHLSGDTAVVLVRPRGETCSLRFPIRIGDSLFIRTSDSDGRSTLCEAKLLSIVGDAEARFAVRCEQRATSGDRKCPPS